MITALFLFPVLAFILGLVSLLPADNAAVPTAMLGTISAVNGYLGALYATIPNSVVALLSVIAFFVIYETAIFTWKGINWILRRIPTQS